MENNIRTIAFPSIATGIYRFPVEKAAVIAIGTVGKFVEENADCIDMVEWVLFDENTEKIYREEIEKYYRERK